MARRSRMPPKNSNTTFTTSRIVRCFWIWASPLKPPASLFSNRGSRNSDYFFPRPNPLFGIGCRLVPAARRSLVSHPPKRRKPSWDWFRGVPQNGSGQGKILEFGQNSQILFKSFWRFSFDFSQPNANYQSRLSSGERALFPPKSDMGVGQRTLAAKKSVSEGERARFEQSERASPRAERRFSRRGNRPVSFRAARVLKTLSLNCWGTEKQRNQNSLPKLRIKLRASASNILSSRAASRASLTASSIRPTLT